MAAVERDGSPLLFVYEYTWGYMTLGRCPLSIFCSRGTPSVGPTNPESINDCLRLSHRKWLKTRPESGLDWLICCNSLDSGQDAFHPEAARFQQEREFFIANLLVQIHFIIVMIRWTGLAPCEDLAKRDGE